MGAVRRSTEERSLRASASLGSCRGQLWIGLLAVPLVRKRMRTGHGLGSCLLKHEAGVVRIYTERLVTTRARAREHGARSYTTRPMCVPSREHINQQDMNGRCTTSLITSSVWCVKRETERHGALQTYVYTCHLRTKLGTHRPQLNGRGPPRVEVHRSPEVHSFVKRS